MLGVGLGSSAPGLGLGFGAGPSDLGLAQGGGGFGGLGGGGGGYNADAAAGMVQMMLELRSGEPLSRTRLAQQLQPSALPVLSELRFRAPFCVYAPQPGGDEFISLRRYVPSPDSGPPQLHSPSPAEERFRELVIARLMSSSVPSRGEVSIPELATDVAIKGAIVDMCGGVISAQLAPRFLAALDALSETERTKQNSVILRGDLLLYARR
jgi:hypothetical protein